MIGVNLKILKTFKKATPEQKKEMYRVLRREIDNLRVILLEMEKVFNNDYRD